MSEEVKYCGKYDSPEALEKGYKELQKKHDELAQKSKSFVIPDEYEINEDLKLVDNEIIDSIKKDAIKYNMTQDQFEKNVKDRVNKYELKNKSLKEVKDALSDDYDILKDYVTKDMGLSESTFNKMSIDELKTINKIRDEALSTKTKMGGGAGTPSIVTEKDVHKAFVDLQNARKSGSSESINRAIKTYSETIKMMNSA